MTTEGVVFADEKVARTVSQEFGAICRNIPDEKPNSKITRIALDPDPLQRKRGMYAALFSGRTIPTGQEHVLDVSERVLSVFEKLNIPYREVDRH